MQCFEHSKVILLIRPIESHSGARGNILVGPLWEENF